MIACPPLSTPAEFRAAFASVVSLEDLQALARVLLKRALEGNLTAAKMVLTYVMGKPNAKPEAPAPTPAPSSAEVPTAPQRKEPVSPSPSPRPASAAADSARKQMPEAKSPGLVSEPRIAPAGQSHSSDPVIDRTAPRKASSAPIANSSTAPAFSS